jgi:hypothetical protein
LVAGSSVFGAPNPTKAISDFKALSFRKFDGF